MNNARSQENILQVKMNTFKFGDETDTFKSQEKILKSKF